MAVKRWTKAAPERAQVVASGRGSGMSHPSGGAYGRAGLCPGDCGSRGARREKLRHLLTATDACRLAILEKGVDPARAEGKRDVCMHTMGWAVWQRGCWTHRGGSSINCSRACQE